MAETARRIRWISSRVVSRRKSILRASKPVVSRLLATVSEPPWNMALTFRSIEDRVLFFHLPPPPLHLIFSTELPQQRGEINFFSPRKPAPDVSVLLVEKRRCNAIRDKEGKSRPITDRGRRLGYLPLSFHSVCRRYRLWKRIILHETT